MGMRAGYIAVYRAEYSKVHRSWQIVQAKTGKVIYHRLSKEEAKYQALQMNLADSKRKQVTL
jgi:hypothetical protein